jgi:3-methyl-2-oxobutanoate hydroxymethyltransferase
MLNHTAPVAKTIPILKSQKGKEKIVCLTAYSAQFAKLLNPHVDLILVGDSVGMVLYGMPSTLGVSLDMMIAHGRAVAQHAQQACVIVDMPFGSYQESPEIAYRNAARIMRETGCNGVKLEGGEFLAETVSFLTDRGIPVMGHVGLLPQSVNNVGGFRARGKTPVKAAQILKDAKSIEQAGAFSIVIEAVYEPVAKEITAGVSIPTIGIGASPCCDGQILVTEDILGLTSDYVPRFVKRYGSVDNTISDIVETYAKEVRTEHFPESSHCYIKS